MTVKELKEILNKYPDNLLVLVDGYEAHYDSIEKVKTIKVRDKYKSSLIGRFEEIESEDDWDEKKEPIEYYSAIVIRRYDF